MYIETVNGLEETLFLAERDEILISFLATARWHLRYLCLLCYIKYPRPEWKCAFKLISPVMTFCKSSPKTIKEQQK